MLKKIIGNSAIYGIAPYIPRIVSIFILPLLTEHLTDIDYGIAGTITAYTLALSALSTLGFSAILQVTFFKASNQYKVLWREIYGFLQYWMVIFAIIQGIILYIVIPQEAIENRWEIIFLSNFNTVFFGPSAFIGPLYYQLSQKPIPVAIRSAAAGLLSVFINYICVVLLNYGYMGWYVSSFMGNFIINATYWYSLNKKIGLSPIYNFKRITILKSLKVSLPMIPHYYSVFMINTFNRIVMDNSAISIGKIGEFNMAQQFSNVFESAISAMEKAITPMCMIELKNNNAIKLKKITYIFIQITFSATFLFTLWSKDIFQILINNQTLANTYPIASLLILSLNYRPIYITATNVYFFNMKTKDILYITFGAGILAVIGNIIFIPIWGIWGAAIVTYIAFTYQGYAGFFMRVYKTYSNISYPVFRLFFIQNSISIIALLNMNSQIEIKIILTILTILTNVYLLNLNKNSTSI